MLLRLVTALVLGTATLPAMADDHSHAMAPNQPMVTQVWSRAMPPSAPTGAVYFTLMNHGDTPDRLLAVQTPQAEKAELHTSVHEGDVMRMERVESIELPARSQVAFQPGGHHVMLFKLTKPLVAGEHFPVTLTFEQAGDLTLDVPIREQGPDGHSSEHMQH